MTLKYTRIFSSLYIVVSLAIGVPLMWALAHNAIKSQYNWIAWTFVFIAAVVLLQGIMLFVAPPTVLKINSDGIHIYYKAGRSFSKDCDLLPWRLIEKMQLIRLHGSDNSFNWAIELILTAPAPFDATKRDALQNTIFSTIDPNRFYLDTFVLNRPRGEVLEVLQSALQCWQEKARHETHSKESNPQGQTYAFDKTRQTNGEKGEVPTRQFDNGRAENLPDRVNCANR